MEQDIVDKKVDDADLIGEEDGHDIFLGGSCAHGIKSSKESHGVTGMGYQMVPGECKVAQGYSLFIG